METLLLKQKLLIEKARWWPKNVDELYEELHLVAEQILDRWRPIGPT